MPKHLAGVLQNRALFILVVMIAALASARLMVADGMGGTEDNLLFYMMGLNLIEADRLFQLNQQVLDYFTSLGADPHSLYRLEFRRDYLNEFPLPGSIYLFVSRFLKGLFDQAPNLYPLYLGQSLVMGLSTAVVITISASTALIVSLKRPAFLSAYGMMICLFAITEFLPLTAHSFATLFINETMAGTLEQTAELLARPGAQFSPLGFSPRSHFALFLVAALAFRWSGRIDISYLLLLVMSFIHLSSSGLILLVFVIIDLFLRPSTFRKPIIATSVLVAIGLFAYRQSMWHLVGDAGWYALPVVAAIVVLAGLAAFIEPIRATLQKLLKPFFVARTYLISRNAISSDLILLVTGWVLSFVVLWAVFVIANPFDKLSGFYFWGRVHGRVMMVLWPSVVFGSLLLWHYRISKSKLMRYRIKAFVPAFCFLLMLPLAYSALNSWQNVSVMGRVVADLFKAENRLSQGPLRELNAMGPGELVIYYAISRTIDSGKNHTTLLFP